MTISKMVKESYQYQGIEINPGDFVLYAATSWKSTRLNFGWYLGFHWDNKKKIPHVISCTPKTGYRLNRVLDEYERYNTYPISILTLGRVFHINHFKEL
jgi:hypothetical protein